MRKHGKVDALQGEIVRALRLRGVSVQSLASVGEGCPDLLCGYRQHTYLLEIKREDGKPTVDQINWWREWNGAAVDVVRSVHEAVRAIGIKS